MDNDSKHIARANQEFLKVESGMTSQSPVLSRIRCAFRLLKTRLKAERPTNEQLKTAAVKAKPQK